MTQLDLSFDSVFGNQPAAPSKNNIDLSFDTVFGNAPYGYRSDGTPKGEGWLGLIPMNDGRVMSELEVGVEFDGKETPIPAIVPGLSDEQIDYLKAGGDPRENREIMQMAQDHAMQRMRAGKSPFADADYEKPKPSFLDRDKERYDIGRGVMRQAQEYLDSGKPIEDIDEDILSFMLSDDSRAEYVLETKQYDDLRQALQERQSEELGTFGGILAEVTDVAKTAASGAVGVIASTPQALGRAYETIRDTAIDMVADTDTPVGQVIDVVTRQMLEKQTKPMIKGGEKLDEASRELLETELFANKAAEMNMKLNDPRTWVMSVSRGAGQMIPMLAAGAVTGGTGVAVFGYGMGADQIYDGVYDVLGKAEGMSTQERDRIAREYAAVGGAISAVLEMAGIEKVLGRIGKNKTTLGQYFKDIAVASMAEGLTEAAQTSLEQTLNYMADETIPMDERVNIATKFVENMFTSETALAAGTGAIVGGGAVAVGSPVASKLDEKKLRKKFVEPYVRDRQPEPDQIEIEGQQYIRQESTGNLIPATTENIAQEREAQRATIEADLQTQEAEDAEFLEATGENYVVVRDGEVVGEFDPAGSDELNESLRASGRDPDETDMQDFAFEEAERVAATEGGEVMLESEYLRDTREQQAAERRRTLAETDPELIELTPAEQSLQVIDRAATERTGVQHTSRVMTSRESSPVANKIRTIGERAGLEIVVVDTQVDEGVSAFPAVIDPTNSRRIFVEDSGSQSEMLKLVFGHELFHTLEKENPDLYDALVSQLPSQFRQRLAEYRATGMLGDNPTVSQQLSEGFAALTEQSLLGLGTESLFDGDATKIQRFKDFVRRMMVRLGMQGKYAKDVLNVMQQIAGGVDLADIGLTKKQERRVDRLRRDAARSKPAETQAQPQPETAPVAGVTQEDIDAEPDLTVQFAGRRRTQTGETTESDIPLVYRGQPSKIVINVEPSTPQAESLISDYKAMTYGVGMLPIADGRLVIDPDTPAEVRQRFENETALPPDFQYIVGKLHITPSGGNNVNLMHIATTRRGSGHGTAILKMALQLADKHGVKINAKVQKFGEGGLSQNDLRSWYTRHGFDVTATDSMSYTPASDVQFAARRVPKVNYRTANASEIIAAHKANKRQSFLSPKDPDDLQSDIDRGKVIAVISNDGTSGYLLDRNDPDDISLGYDIQGVFNIGPVKGAGQAALADAISRGGRTLDAYDGYLPALYSSYGFVETHRAPYNEEFASAEFGPMEGRPDVVLMTYVREETDAEQIIAAKSEPTTAAPGPYNIAKDGSNWPDYATRVAGLLRAPVSEQPADGRDVRATGEDARRLLEEEVQFAARLDEEQLASRRLAIVDARQVIPTGGKQSKTVTVLDAANAFIRPRTDYKDPTQFDAAVERAVQMVELQLEQEQSGLGWYDKDIVSAFVETAKVYPELADPNRHTEKQVFLTIAAVLSNGQKAPQNWKDAALVYGEYKRTGRLIRRKPNGALFGTRGNTIAQQFSILEHMFDVMGEANTAIWLTSQKSIDEMRSIRRGAANDLRLADSSFKNDAMYKVSQTMGIAGRKDKTNYGAYVLGPKIGPFFLNLNGINETTIDVWAMRTFGREFGTLLDNPSKETGVNDAPSDIERPYAKRFFEEIGKRLGIKEQDAQAVAWFAEKELYLAAGVKSAKSWYFSDGAKQFVESPSGQSSVRAAAPTVGAGSSIQFAARRVPSKKEQVRWLTGQVKDPELLEMQAKYRSASPIAKEAYREGRREAKAEAKEQREVYTTAAKGILDAARNRQKKLKSGFKDIEKMRRELRQLMQKVLSPKDRGRYLAMLDNVRTENQMKAALQKIINKSAKSGWSDEVSRYRRAVKRVGRHRDIPDSVRKELDELVERGKRQSTEKVAIKSGPNTGKLTTRMKNIGGVQANVEATTDLAKTTDEMLEKLLAALEYKRVTKEGRGVMIGTAIDEILKDLRAGAKPLKRSIKVRGKKGDARTSQSEIKTGKFMTALLWHRQIPNIIKVITRDPNGRSVFHKLFVDDMRVAESNMELRKQQIIAELEEAAKLAGFKSLEDASVRLDASHGIGLANPLIEITLGGKKIQLLEGELLHLALMDAGTVEQIIYDNVPLKIARAGESAIVIGDVDNGGRPITNQEFSEAIGKLDPKVLAYGQYLKDKINSLSPEMQQALRKLQGYDAEMIPDYFPISRDVSETKFGSEIDMNAMLSGKSAVGKSAVLFAENSGQTKSRVKSKLPIFVKPATNVFSQNIDSTLRIIYMAEPIRNADAITRDSRVKQEITNRHGTRVYQALRQYLAEASGINEHQSGGLGTFFRWMTSNLAGSYIALNPSTMLIQFSGIPRLYGRVNLLDITKGIAWATANIRRLGSIMEQHGYFADRWSRSTITRFGPQQYGGLVPVNKDGFMRGVTDALVSLTRMDMKSFNKSWRSANDSIQVLDAIDKFICGVAYGANLAKAKRESPQLSEANLQERALEGAVLDIRETQNSSSRLDLSVSASDWRRSPAGEAFLLFSSDRFTLLNRLSHGKRLLQEGNKAEGARIIMGSMMSMAAEVPIRQAYWSMITAGVFALFGGEDDDRKKAERAKKAEEVWYTNIVRSFVGMSPIFGGLFETGASIFMDKMYSDAFLSSAAGDAVSNIARNGKRAASEFMKLTDEEQEFAVDVAISSTVNMLSQIAALTTGNPLHPIVNKLMRGWVGNGNDPVGDLNKLDTYYSGVEELTDEQREYANEVKRENGNVQRQARKIRSQMNQLRVRDRNKESFESDMRRLQVRMSELELRSMKILGYDEEDLQEYADEKGISLE